MGFLCHFQFPEQIGFPLSPQANIHKMHTKQFFTNAEKNDIMKIVYLQEVSYVFF